MKLVWREEAREDLRGIIRYIAERNPPAAEKLNLQIEACADRLLDHPHMYRPGRAPNTREAVAHPNYILIYQVDADSVEIVSVVHSRRRYPPGDGA